MTSRHTPDPNNNRLAEKLRREYRSRGESLRGISASSTEELMTRAQMGRDPRVNVSEQAFSERVNNRNRYAGPAGTTAGMRPNGGRPAGGARSASGNTRRSGTASAQNTPRRKTANQSELPRAREILIEQKRMPLTFLLLLSFVTLMVMLIILSIAQIYQTTDEISALEYRIQTLQTDAKELELKIEEKNDIRIIEQIATDRLGMVKEDSVQRRYVSLSDGERIDLVMEETDNPGGEGLGSMLSSLWSAFGAFLDGLK